MNFARQSTAITYMVGPVLDADGVAVTDCVIGDFKFSKNGAAPAAFNASATLTHRHTGFYSLAATATDTNTVGTFQTCIDDTVNACPMHTMQVVEEAIYDALFAGSANAFAGAAGASTVVFSNTSIATATAVTTVNGLAANVITAAATAADFTTEIQSGLATAAAVDAVDNFLDTEVAAILAAVDTEVAAIKAVTDLLPNGGALTSLATQASVNTIDDFLDTEVAAILAAVDTEIAALTTAVADVPTNAELTTALADLPTNAELATALTANFDPAVDEVLANLKKVNGVTVAGDGAATPWGP